MRRRADDDVLGNRALERFDVCVVGSGAGGGTAAHVLTAGGLNVLVLEAGHNPYPGLDDPKRRPVPLHGSDEVKYDRRGYLEPAALLEPRTFRLADGTPARVHPDVNVLPKAVGGAFQHADCKTPRFNAVDFRLRSAVEALIAATPGLTVPGFGADAASASFLDWPFDYADLEPFYTEMEWLYGVAGSDTDNPYASPKSRPYPMAPGVPMYLALRLAEGAAATTWLGEPLHPHTYPSAVTSRPWDGREPCNDCGMCAGFGCPIDAKGAPATVTLRKALLSGRCQLRCNAQVVRLVHGGSRVQAAEYVDGDGTLRTAAADAFVLAASPIESARLCLLSENLGNSSDQVGRHLTFHRQNNVNGFLPERVHGERGRAITHGISDFRGVLPGGDGIRVVQHEGSPRIFLGGICEFAASQGRPISEDGVVYALDLPRGLGRRHGIGLKNALRDGALGQHLLGLLMQAEDAPQATNRVDLDPNVRDVFGRPAARVTYRPHAFETETRRYYVPLMRQVLENTGARTPFVNPCETTLGGPPTSRHVMGTLRMGSAPATSVVRPDGRFHDVENLYACDGSVFPTSSGYNPTLTIFAVAAKIAHGMAGTAPVSPFSD